MTTDVSSEEQQPCYSQRTEMGKAPLSSSASSDEANGEEVDNTLTSDPIEGSYDEQREYYQRLVSDMTEYFPHIKYLLSEGLVLYGGFIREVVSRKGDRQDMENYLCHEDGDVDFYLDDITRLHDIVHRLEVRGCKVFYSRVNEYPCRELNYCEYPKKISTFLDTMQSEIINESFEVSPIDTIYCKREFLLADMCSVVVLVPYLLDKYIQYDITVYVNRKNSGKAPMDFLTNSLEFSRDAEDNDHLTTKWPYDDRESVFASIVNKDMVMGEWHTNDTTLIGKLMYRAAKLWDRGYRPRSSTCELLRYYRRMRATPRTVRVYQRVVTHHISRNVEMHMIPDVLTSPAMVGLISYCKLEGSERIGLTD